MLPLFRKSPKPTFTALYGAIVAQARDAAFYETYGVPDTVLGRLDMIILHLALAVRRLREGGDAGKASAQGVFDTFCRDMDDNLREMGISDQGIPKHMQRVGEAFYGRSQAYDAALDGADDRALAEALIRNVYAEGGNSTAAPRLAAYVRSVLTMLGGQAPEAIARGDVRFPAPAMIAEPVS
jgi:cytochrome b pre-mRNA-processing protein 3